MSHAKSKSFAPTEARATVANLYQKLRDDAIKEALSTFGNTDPDLEQVREELHGGKKD